jgi:hypothetical protein
MRLGMAPVHRAGFLRAIAAGGVCAALFAPSLALAAPAPDTGNTVEELTVTASKTVDELTVTAPKKCLKPQHDEGWPTRGAKVVSSFPAKGAVVRPGVLVLRVTFDRPMACAGVFSDDPPFHNPCPGRIQHMLLSYDRLTVRTACVVEPNGAYGAWISKDVAFGAFVGGDSEHTDFISLTGSPSNQYELRFTTSAAPPVTTVCEALSEDEDTARQIRDRQKLDCSKAPAATGG